MSIDNAVLNAMSQAIQATSGDERRMYEALQKYYRTKNRAYEHEAAKIYHRLSDDARRRVDYLGQLVGSASQYHF